MYKKGVCTKVPIYTYHIIVNANICTYIYIPSFLCKTSSSLLCSEGSLSSPNESRRIGQLWLLYMCTQDLRIKYARYPLMCMHIYIYVCIYIFLWIYVYRVCMYIQIICNHLHMPNIYVYILYVCKCMICTHTLILNKNTHLHVCHSLDIPTYRNVNKHK